MILHKPKSGNGSGAWIRNAILPCLVLLPALAWGVPDPDELRERLRSTNAVTAAEAVRELRTYCNYPQKRYPFANGMIPALMESHRYDEAIDLAELGLMRHGWDLMIVDILQRHKIKALLILGRNEEALAESKALFNVIIMKHTGSALKLMEECLAAAHPDDPGIVERFRKEQEAGNRQPSDEGTTVVRSPIMDSIGPATDLTAELPEKYSIIGGGFGYLKANLALMAGRPAEARSLLETSLKEHSFDSAQLQEGLLRCLKTEDGTLGRALAMLDGQKKAEQPPQAK